MSIEAMKQALEALETLARYENPETKIQVRKPKDGGPIVTMYPHKVASDAAQSLRQAIEQAEKQEPVADVTENGIYRTLAGINLPIGTKLYTTPQPQREWVGLTDDEMLMIYGQQHEGKKYSLGRMVEQALKEKNT